MKVGNLGGVSGGGQRRVLLALFLSVTPRLYSHLLRYPQSRFRKHPLGPLALHSPRWGLKGD